jgi:chromosomal replication initiator protein
MALDLDPRFTFDAFVVGPANRLAVAAARRVSDTPGTTYNPLFIYSGSGLGKTHLLGAIGHHVERVHSLPVVFDTMEHLMEAINAAVEAGERDAFRGRLRDARLLLLDDVQFLAGQRQVQEELIRAWDALSSRGAQVVLTSDRPPQEIDGLDDRLLSRLSGGLIVDMSPPDYETRIAIARRKAGERGSTLSKEVFQALARIAFTNVRELQGALNRLIAVQELEGREVTLEEVPRLLGAAAERGHDEFGEFLADIAGSVGAVVEDADRRIADAILAWEGDGFRTRRLDSALTGTVTSAQAEEVVRRFEADVFRLREIRQQIVELDPGARELQADVLRDPDRVAEAESLLAGVRERLSPPPAPPDGIALADIEGGDSLAVRAARAVADAPGRAYNPLYVMGPDGSGRSTVLIAVANELQREGITVAYVDGATFAEELIDALERSRLEAWRARYRRAQALVLDDLDQLAGLERGHDELFHLFEELHREGRQLVFSAAVAPHDLPVPSRLQSRLEAGLVVELEPREARRAVPGEPGEPAEPGEAGEAGEAGSNGGPESPSNGGAEAARQVRASGHWILSREKVLWEWPYPRDWLEESLD